MKITTNFVKIWLTWESLVIAAEAAVTNRKTKITEIDFIYQNDIFREILDVHIIRLRY